MHDVVFSRFDREHNRLVAFNADSWKGGFDLPFLRTRCFVQDQPWVFDGLQFADLWEPLKRRLNTTSTASGSSTSVNSLTGSHALLCRDATWTAPVCELPESHPLYQQIRYDPFTDSGSAVYCYSQEEYRPILEHNLADVHRTWELGALIREYVPAKDITVKE